MLLKLCRNIVKNLLDLHLIPLGMFDNITSIEGKNVTFHPVNPSEITGIHICFNCLRHTPYNEILPEIIHCLSMEGLAQRFSIVKADSYEIHQCFIPKRPQKFLKIQRMHGKVSFL
ncbi:hypothetical protein SDC9_144838 [bioreactor metagenome]|uniref:Uncharacterized protein n=1 Tax=bioreactor metagenome TaxID=1076179 RepID=A0A645E8A9_9ZZZZ